MDLLGVALLENDRSDKYCERDYLVLLMIDVSLI